jgi:ParB family transcriptional regulator, chromosome partitioning protein
VIKLWNKAKDVQLDLLETSRAPVVPSDPADLAPRITTTQRVGPSAPQLLPLTALCEDPHNPRTEFPEAELSELAEDVRQHGVLQPIVIHPADEQVRHQIHFGVKRRRAAQRAGLTEVPVVVRDMPTDPYTQVAENQKRHGLTPLDLARFIQARVDAGDSNATIAKRLGMDLTSVAHHLALLELPSELNEAMQSGRCTSPRTLHELNKLHRTEPERVRALLAGDGEITRSNVKEARAEPVPTAHAPTQRRAQPPLLTQADAAFARLELVLDRIAKAGPRFEGADLERLKQRVASFGSRLA